MADVDLARCLVFRRVDEQCPNDRMGGSGMFCEEHTRRWLGVVEGDEGRSTSDADKDDDGVKSEEARGGEKRSLPSQIHDTKPPKMPVLSEQTWVLLGRAATVAQLVGAAYVVIKYMAETFVASFGPAGGRNDRFRSKIAGPRGWGRGPEWYSTSFHDLDWESGYELFEGLGGFLRQVENGEVELQEAEAVADELVRRSERWLLSAPRDILDDVLSTTQR